jgi:hypothetical protein
MRKVAYLGLDAHAENCVLDFHKDDGADQNAQKGGARWKKNSRKISSSPLGVGSF